MEKDERSREKLIERQKEINDQLARLGGGFNHELDRDPEEQAIEIQQVEVPMAMIDNLRRELAEIEESLAA
jgi:RNA polymerase-binding transcription factor DksA